MRAHGLTTQMCSLAVFPQTEHVISQLTSRRMVFPSSTVNDDFADVRLTLKNFDEMLRVLSNTDSPLPVATDDSSSVTMSDGAASDTRSSSAKDEPTANHKIRRAREAKRRRLYRENQKLGRDELRRQVVEVGNELARLKQAQANEKARLEASRPPAFYFWKSVALQHREERLLAEAEKMRLISAVNTQATYIEMLSNIPRLLVGHDGSSTRTKINCPMVDEAAIFDACIRELDANYAQANEVYEACRFDELGTNTTVQSEQRRESDGKLKYLQRLTKEVQPYSLYETGCSLWDMADHYHAAKEGSNRYEDVPENTYAIAFDDNKILNTGMVMVVRQRLVFRRFYEDERIVFTWKFISEGQESCSGMHQEESGWCWVNPLTETTEPGTVVTMCIRRAPMSYTSSASEVTRDEFSQLLQNNEKETWEKMMSSLDKLLLDNVLAGVGLEPVL